MKLEFGEAVGGGIAPSDLMTRWSVRGETDRLTDVLVCSPAHLAPVPCCSVTRQSLREGFQASPDAAAEQHAALRRALQCADVKVHDLPAIAGLPDLCFTRDAAVMTPWGLLLLNPALPHRRREVDHLAGAARRMDVPVAGRISAGTLEGGDVCVAAPGLLVLGCSGERSDEGGVGEIADLFAHSGWKTLVAPFDPHFLHLDTIFCMLDATSALACPDALDDRFRAQVDQVGIEIVPVTYKESRRLGCNIVSLGGRRLLSSQGNDRINRVLRARGFAVTELDISQFAACGGGLHCLTMPLARL